MDMKTYFSIPVIIQFVKVLLMLALILVGVKLKSAFISSGEFKLTGTATNLMYWLLIPISLVLTFMHVKTLKALGISEVTSHHSSLKQQGVFQSNLQKENLLTKLKQDPFF